MTKLIDPKTAAVASAVEFDIAEGYGLLRMTADPGASGAFAIVVKGYPSDAVLTLDTNTTTATKLRLGVGSYEVTKTLTSNSCGLYCVGRHVQCLTPG